MILFSLYRRFQSQKKLISLIKKKIPIKVCFKLSLKKQPQKCIFLMKIKKNLKIIPVLH
jgi:hypothetical protein